MFWGDLRFYVNINGYNSLYEVSGQKKKEFHDRNSYHYISNARIINIIQHILKVEILKSVELDESDHSAKLMREL